MRRIKPIISLYPHQMEYVTSSHRHPAIIAGYGSGKTFSNIQRILYLLELREGSAYIFYGAPTYDIISSSFLPDFEETLDFYGIKNKPNRQEHIIRITEPGLEGIVKYLSLDSYERIVGFTATDGILDEFDVLPYRRQKPTWNRALARLRGVTGATLSITSTPEGFKFCHELNEAGKIHQINASTTDNKSLPETFIEDLVSNYDEAHRQMYIHGKYVNLNGLQAIYAFTRDKLIDPISYADLPNNITVGMDFNVDPSCMAVSATIDGIKKTVDEFHIRNMSGSGHYASYTDKAICMLLNKYPTKWYAENYLDKDFKGRTFDIRMRPDNTGDSRKTNSNTTDHAIIRKYNLPIDGSFNPEVPKRLKISNIAMNTNRWQVTKNCTELIKDFEMVVTDAHGDLQIDDAKKDKDSKNLRGHLLDAVTYDVYFDFKHLVYKPQTWTIQ